MKAGTTAGVRTPGFMLHKLRQSYMLEIILFALRIAIGDTCVRQWTSFTTGGVICGAARENLALTTSVLGYLYMFSYTDVTVLLF